LDAQPAAKALIPVPAVQVDNTDVNVTIDIDLKQVEADAIVTRNEVDMEDAAHAMIALRRQIRPKRTIKGYRKGLVCWAAFCTRRHFTDGNLVHEKKILLFLKEDVLTMRTPMKRRSRTLEPSSSLLSLLSPSSPLPMLPLTPETIEAGYISPLIDLWTEQTSLGKNSYPHPRGALLRGLVQNLKREKADQTREAFEDRAIGKLNDGYTAEEYRQLCSEMLAKTDQLEQWLRTRLDIQLLHAGMLRSESNRLLELPNLFVHQLGGEEGEGSWTPSVVMMITEGKTLKIGHTDYTGLLRHKDPVLCPIASLALYLFWRFHIGGEQPPNFNNRESWYHSKLFPGKQEGGSLSYETQAKWISQAFADAGIHSSKVSHTMRGASARLADALDTPENQVS
jgi:hypothetical protein